MMTMTMMTMTMIKKSAILTLLLHVTFTIHAMEDEKKHAFSCAAQARTYLLRASMNSDVIKSPTKKRLTVIRKGLHQAQNLLDAFDEPLNIVEMKKPKIAKRPKSMTRSALTLLKYSARVAKKTAIEVDSTNLHTMSDEIEQAFNPPLSIESAHDINKQRRLANDMRKQKQLADAANNTHTLDYYFKQPAPPENNPL